MSVDDERVAEWLADFAACEKAEVQAEVATWSPWLMNSMNESEISQTELSEYLRIGQACPNYYPRSTAQMHLPAADALLDPESRDRQNG